MDYKYRRAIVEALHVKMALWSKMGPDSIETDVERKKLSCALKTLAIHVHHSLGTRDCDLTEFKEMSETLGLSFGITAEANQNDDH